MGCAHEKMEKDQRRTKKNLDNRRRQRKKNVPVGSQILIKLDKDSRPTSLAGQIEGLLTVIAKKDRYCPGSKSGFERGG